MKTNCDIIYTQGGPGATAADHFRQLLALRQRLSSLGINHDTAVVVNDRTATTSPSPVARRCLLQARRNAVCLATTDLAALMPGYAGIEFVWHVVSVGGRVITLTADYFRPARASRTFPTIPPGMRAFVMGRHRR